jgi:hypothetical protein
MAELFRLSADGSLVQVPEREFLNEVADLEDFLVKNPGLLGEGMIFLARQIDIGPAGRIDLLLLESTEAASQVVVVELKNEPADVRVLLQSLRYASWVISNPDSIRLQLEKAQLKTDVDLKPKIIIAAPLIQDELLELTQYVGSFEFDLVEIRRFEQMGESFVLVTHKVPLGVSPAGIRVQEEWNWERFEQELGWRTEQAELGQSLLNSIDEWQSSNGYGLKSRFRKSYVAFQLNGTKNVVGLEKRWAQGVAIWFRLPDDPKLLGLTIPGGHQSHWSQVYKQFYVNQTGTEINLDEYRQLFEAAYSRAGGK